MLGITNYQPNFSYTASEFIAKHKSDLQDLIGKPIDAYYLQWDVSDNTWNEDGPIVLAIAGNQYEFTAFKSDEYSLTINQINLEAKLDWYGMTDDFPLTWNKNPLKELNNILSKKIKHIYLLEYSITAGIKGDVNRKAFFQKLTHADFFIVGIAFELSGLDGCLQLSNGLDCNAMKIAPIQLDAQNKCIKVV